jgi:AraC-like DNA-binding protein
MESAPNLIARATLDRAMAYARERGLDPLAFRLAGATRPGPVTAAGNWVPLDALAQFLAWAASESGDPSFGLLVGARFHPSDLGAYGYMLLNAPNLGTALALGQRFMNLLQQGGAFATRADDGVLEISYRAHGLAPHLRSQDAEYTLAIIHAVVRAIAGRAVRPQSVRVAHGGAGREGEWRAVFGCPAASGAADNAICYDAAILALPVAGADARLLAILTEYVERELEGAPPQGDFVPHILWAIRATLADGPSLGRVARQCGIGERTLQRRLAAQGVSFAALVDDVRRDMDSELRRAGRFGSDALAAALGFHDGSALAKARRRWWHRDKN